MWVWMKKEEAYVAPEFEYERLAKEITKATNEAEKVRQKFDAPAKIVKFLLIGMLVFALLLLLLLGFDQIITTFFAGAESTFEQKASAILSCVIFVNADLIIGGMIYSVTKITDKSYLVSYASTVIALSALIVAALNIGVRG